MPTPTKGAAAEGAARVELVKERRPPECSDQRTLAGALDLIREKMLPGEGYRSIPREEFLDYVYIDAARPTRWDKDNAQFECVGTVVVDSSSGADPLGRALMLSPQALYAGGSSVAEVERVLLASLSPDRLLFAYPLRFSSQLAGEDHYVAVDRIGDVHAMLTGSFVVGHRSRVTGTDRAAEPEKSEKR